MYSISLIIYTVLVYKYTIICLLILMLDIYVIFEMLLLQ